MKHTITHEQEVRCLLEALKAIENKDLHADHGSRYDKALSYFDYVSQVAHSYAAEWAVADFLGIEYTPDFAKYKDRADVGSQFEVKWTKHSEGQLIIYESDRNTDIAILITGHSPTFRIAGWIPIAVAKKARYRHRSQPTWWVTQANLQPIENLSRSVHAHSGI